MKGQSHVTGLHTGIGTHPSVAHYYRRHRAQGSRSCTAVASRERERELNLAEGMYSRGKNRSVRYHTALGSARETWACLEVAHAAGYIKPIDPALLARMNQVTGTLVRLVERSQ